jgi:hypothetical protein
MENPFPIPEKKILLQQASELKVNEIAKTSNSRIVRLYISTDQLVEILAEPPDPHVLVKVKNTSDEGQFLYHCLKLTASLAKQNILLDLASLQAFLDAGKEAFDSCDVISDPLQFLTSKDKLTQELGKASLSRNMTALEILLRMARAFISKSSLSMEQQKLLFANLRQILKEKDQDSRVCDSINQFFSIQDVVLAERFINNQIANERSNISANPNNEFIENSNSQTRRESEVRNSLEHSSNKTMPVSEDLTEQRKLKSSKESNLQLNQINPPKDEEVVEETLSKHAESQNFTKKPDKTKITAENEVSIPIDRSFNNVSLEINKQQTDEQKLAESNIISTYPIEELNPTSKNYRVQSHPKNLDTPEAKNQHHQTVIEVLKNCLKDLKYIKVTSKQMLLNALSTLLVEKLYLISDACIFNLLDALVYCTLKDGIEHSAEKSAFSLFNNSKSTKIEDYDRINIINKVAFRYRQKGQTKFCSANVNASYWGSCAKQTKNEITNYVYELYQLLSPDLDEQTLKYCAVLIRQAISTKDLHPLDICAVYFNLNSPAMASYLISLSTVPREELIIKLFNQFLTQILAYFDNSNTNKRIIHFLSKLSFALDNGYMSTANFERTIEESNYYLALTTEERIKCYLSQAIGGVANNLSNNYFMQALLKVLNTNVTDQKRVVKNACILVDSIRIMESVNQSNFPMQIVDHLKDIVFANFDVVMIDIVSQENSAYYELVLGLQNLLELKILSFTSISYLIITPFIEFCKKIQSAQNISVETIKGIGRNPQKTIEYCEILWNLLQIKEVFGKALFSKGLTECISLVVNQNEIIKKFRGLQARKEEYGAYDVGILAKQNSKVLEPNHDVSVGEIRSIENLLKNYEYLFRSPLLIDIELYKKRMLGQSAKSGMKELEQECKAAEELLTLTLKGWASKMPVSDANKAKGLASYLTPESSLIKLGIVNEAQVQKIILNIKAVYIVHKIKKEEDSITTLIGLLKDNKKLQNPRIDEQVIDKIIRAVESTDKLIAELRKLDLFNLLSKSSSLEVGIQDDAQTSQSNTLTQVFGCKDLIFHFKDKQPRHYHDMVVERTSRVKIDVESISATQRLVDCYLAKDKFDSVFEFISLCETVAQRFDLHKLSTNSRTLIEYSKELLDDNLVGAKTTIDILNSSVFLLQFNQETKSYQITCKIEDPSHNKSMKSYCRELSKHKSLQNNSELYSRQELSFATIQDLRVKLALFSSSLSNLSNSMLGEKDNDFNRAAVDFVQIVSLLESIKSLLTYIARTGSVLDLLNLIDEKLQTNPDAISEILHEFTFDNLAESFYYNEFNVVIRTRPRYVQSSNQFIDHFKVLMITLSMIKSDLEKQYFTSVPKYHEITCLEGFQKQFLCKHFSEQRDAPHNDTLIEEDEQEMLSEEEAQMEVNTINSLMRFMNIKEVDYNRLVENKVEAQSLSESTLELIFAKLNIATMKRNSSEITPRKFSFISYTKPEERYYSLFNLMDRSQINFFYPYQLLLCSPTTVNTNINLFMERALKDSERRCYYIVDPHLLGDSILDHLIYVAKKFTGSDRAVVANYNLALIVLNEPGTSAINKLLSAEKIFMAENMQINRSETKKRSSYRKFIESCKIEVITSEKSGMGKSTYIRKEINKTGVPSAIIHLSGDPSEMGIERRLQIIDQLLTFNQNRGQLALHIKLDMMDNMQNSCSLLDQLLFQICCLKCVPYRKGYLFLERIFFIYIEVQNGYRDLLLESIGVLSLFQRKSMRSFSSVESLQQEMDIVEFVRSVEEGWDPKDRNEVTNSSVITDFICFYSGLQSKLLGTENLSNISIRNPNNIFDLNTYQNNRASKNQKTNRDHSDDATILSLVNLIHQMISSSGQILSEGTWAQITNIVKVVVWQAREMDLVPGLNPQILKMDRLTSSILSNFSEVRLITANQIVRNSVELAWATASRVKEEKEEAMRMMQEKELGVDIFKQTALKAYEEKVKSIPKWSFCNHVNYFFYEGSLKIIYKDINELDQKTIEVIEHQTRKKPEDFSKLEPSYLSPKLLNELSEALGLKQKMKVPDKYFKDHPKTGNDELYYMYLKDRVASFNSDKGYVITHDNYLKILMIIQRAYLQIPIVIMGATGCGKTYMIQFLAECLLQHNYKCFTLHSGVSERDIIELMNEERTKALKSPNETFWILFDEFNTSPLQCLISEIMVDRRSTFCEELSGLEFPPNMKFVAACNPYRITSTTTSVGLVHESATRILTHRVHPIPDTLINYLWDFGQLDSTVERQYINSMIDCSKYNILPAVREVISQTISCCQHYLRNVCSDNSVSLRDVSRFADLYTFLKELFKENPLDPLVVTTHLSYFCRLERRQDRVDLCKKLNSVLRNVYQGEAIDFLERFKILSRLFGKDVEKLEVIPQNITLNVPLLENLLAIYVCVLCKIPLIICGKPGTSKSLSVNIIDAAFNARQDLKNKSEFFRNTPKVMPISFWGSLNTTSQSIKTVFERAEQNEREYKKEDKKLTSINVTSLNSNATSVYIVFDEIGLAEIAPDNPLKILHPLLEPSERKVSFIGLSNWKLDQSKMNRVIYIARPDMDEVDLLETCKLEMEKFVFEGIGDKMEKRMEALSKAFYNFRQDEVNGKFGNHNNFFGARDFYEIMKLFKRSFNLVYQSSMQKIGVENTDKPEDVHKSNYWVSKLDKEELIDLLIYNSIQRNFSGKMIFGNPSFETMIRYCNESLHQGIRKNVQAPINTMELIYQNLLDKNGRHMMILTEDNSVVEEVLLNQIREFEESFKKKPRNRFEFLCPAKGQEETATVVKSKLPLYIKNGFTIVMKNLPEVYGCMYDLLNQNYTTREADGDKFCDLFFDNTKLTVPVNRDFKCIILMAREDDNTNIRDIEKRQQPPFLNRFEKYLVLDEHIIPQDKLAEKKRLERLFLSNEQGPLLSQSKSLIHNLSKELIMSIFVKEESKTIEGIKNTEKIEQVTFRDYLLNFVKPLNRNKETKGMNPKCAQSVKQMLARIGNTQQPNNSTSENEDILRLLSRNAIYQRMAERASPNQLFQSLNFEKEDFLRTHPFNSLEDYLKNIVASGLRGAEHKNKGAIFTYTPVWETRELAKGKYQIVDFNEVEGWTEEDGKPLLVLFSKRSTWMQAQPLRRSLEATVPPIKRTVVFIFHYSMDDFMYKGQYLSGITYFNKNWDLCVIDDLVNSNYNKFFDVFQMTCSTYIEEIDKSNKGDSVSFTQQIVREAIGSYLLFKADKQNLNSIIRYSKCREILISNTSILESILAELKSTNHKNKPIWELVRSAQQDNDPSASNHLIFDIAKLIQTKVNSFYSTIIYETLASFEKYLPLDLISYSELLEPRIRGEMMMEVEQCFKAFMAKDLQLLSSIGPFGQFSSIRLDYKQLRANASITVKQIKILLDKKDESKKADLKKIVREQADGQFLLKAESFIGSLNNLDKDSEVNNLLLASYLFEKYIIQLEQGNIAEFAMKIAMRIASLINSDISSKPYKEILSNYIVVAELFLYEVMLIHQLSLVLDRKQRTTLENAILSNFESSSELLNSEQLSPLFIIPTFKTKEDVQQSTAYLSALYETLHLKAADRMEPVVSTGFRVFLCVLRWFEEIYGDEGFDDVYKRYLSINRTDNDGTRNKPFFRVYIKVHCKPQQVRISEVLFVQADGIAVQSSLPPSL